MVFGFGWKPHFTHTQIPQLTGKVAVVTGANSGLGLEVSKQLALNGARVILGVRNHGKGAQARAEIDSVLTASERRHPGGSVELLPTSESLELSDISKIKSWTQHLLTLVDRLDILICSAAIVPGNFTLSPSAPKHELTYATNHLGHFYLVSQLLHLLRKTASAQDDVRIVIVAADVTSHVDSFRLVGNRDWLLDQSIIDSPHNWSRLNAYARTKMCNVLFARRLAALLKGKKESVRVNTLHAGVFFSDIFFSQGHEREHGAEVGWWERATKGVARGVGGLVAMSPTESGLTTLYAATSPEIKDKDYRGEFFTPYGILSTPNLCRLCLDDEGAGKELWAKSITQLAEAGEEAVFADLGDGDGANKAA